MKIGTSRSCAHSQNGKSGLGVEELAVPTRRNQKAFEASGPRQRSLRGYGSHRAELSVPRPSWSLVQAPDRGVLIVDVLDDTIAGLLEIDAITSAANGLLMTRLVMPAFAQTSCWRSKSDISR